MKRTVILMMLVMILGSAVGVTAQEPMNEEAVRSIADLERGEYAVIRGTIVRFLDEDELLVSDETGRVEVYLEPWREARRLLREGQTITISGWVDDDWSPLRLELYASAILLEDGTELTFAGDRWE